MRESHHDKKHRPESCWLPHRHHPGTVAFDGGGGPLCRYSPGTSPTHMARSLVRSVAIFVMLGDYVVRVQMGHPGHRFTGEHRPTSAPELPGSVRESFEARDGVMGVIWHRGPTVYCHDRETPRIRIRRTPTSSRTCN